MKLPILELRKISRISQNKKHCINLGKKKSFLHHFLLPNNNISSNLTERKLKYEILSPNSSNTQRYTNLDNTTKSKLIDLTKSRSELFNSLVTKNNANSYLNSYICKSSNRITSNDIDSSDDETYQQNNYETYIKKSLNSFKIKKEISSFLYSSPDKQKRLIHYLSRKFNNNNSNSNINNKIGKKQMTKIKKIFFNLKDDDKKEIDESQNEDNDRDEDKTNLKEFSLFSLFMGNKNIKTHSRINHIRNFKEKFAECWDNNILKNILPQNIKNQSYINLKSNESNKKYEENSFRSKNGKSYILNKLNQFNLNSYNTNNMNRYKYEQRYLFKNNKKIKGLNNIHYLLIDKKITRSASNL